MNKPRLILLNLLVFVITGAIALIAVPIEGFINGFDSAEVITCIFFDLFLGNVYHNRLSQIMVTQSL